MKENYFNADISWLKFNQRVLAQAQIKKHPILERLKFLSISGSNLDEFFMTKFKALKYRAAVIPLISTIILDQIKTWRTLCLELREHGIIILDSKEILEIQNIRQYFTDNILPILTPIIIDNTHPLPLIPTQALNIALELMQEDGDVSYSVIVLPHNMPRFININDVFVVLESLILSCLDLIFPNHVIRAKGIFRIIRNGEFVPKQGNINLIEEYENVLQKRLKGDVMHLAVSANTPESLRLYIAEQMDFDPSEIFVIDGLLGVEDFQQLSNHSFHRLRYPHFTPRLPKRLQTVQNNIFDAIDLKDIILHHPYESFDVIIEFIKQAAKDPDVVAIKQTLYRTGVSDKIVKHLIKAAHNGKSVTVLVEIKARFDEENNIRWAKDLENAGVQVIYGVWGVKTHAKMTLIYKNKDNILKMYAHFGTGNYNPKTAGLYTDLSLLTANHNLCLDASKIFNYLTGYIIPKEFKKLAVAPLNFRQTLIRLIEDEIKHAVQGKPAQIWIKVNSISDTEIIDKLYEASCAGVEIDLVVRGICCLKPGIKGLSENIRVKSIIGRFLEHSRIFCFSAGHPMPFQMNKVFIASADLMPRNFDWRLELMIPIENSTVHQQVLEQIMWAFLHDNSNSWDLDSDGNYQICNKSDFDVQDYFLNHPSLSGQGHGPYYFQSRIIAPN